MGNTIDSLADTLMEQARCLTCGYSLRGLREWRCPECGTEFDPGDRRTMVLPGDGGRVKRFFYGRPGWPLHILAIGATAAIVFSMCFPGMEVLSLMAGLFLWLIVGVGWGIRVLGRIIVVLIYGQPRRKPFVGARAWAVAPGLLAFTILLGATDLPVRFMFRLHRGPMARMAQQVMSSPVAPPVYCRIGLFNMEVDSIAGGAKFRVRATLPFDPSGFIYLPDRQPEPDSTTYKKLGNGWYIYEEHW